MLIVRSYFPFEQGRLFAISSHLGIQRETEGQLWLRF